MANKKIKKISEKEIKNIKIQDFNLPAKIINILFEGGIKTVGGLLKKKEEEFRKEIQKSVERDVKIYLILDKIAEKEGLTVKQEESLPAKVLEFLFKEANWEEKGDSKK